MMRSGHSGQVRASLGAEWPGKGAKCGLKDWPGALNGKQTTLLLKNITIRLETTIYRTRQPLISCPGVEGIEEVEMGRIEDRLLIWGEIVEKLGRSKNLVDTLNPESDL